MVRICDICQGEERTQKILSGTPIPLRLILLDTISRDLTALPSKRLGSTLCSSGKSSRVEKTISGVPPSSIQRSAPPTEEDPISKTSTNFFSFFSLENIPI